MGKFSFGKKGSNDDDDNNSSTRTALFGSRGLSSKSAPPLGSSNPYAHLPSQADAYNAAKARAGVPGFAHRGPSPGPPGPPMSAPATGAAGAQGGAFPDDKRGPGYGANPYGARSGEREGGGYGANPYGARGGEKQGGGYGANPYGARSNEREGGGYGANPYGARSSEKEGGTYGAIPNGARSNEKQGGTYGANPYGAQGGYGDDRFGSNGGPSAGGSGSRFGAGGYGGLGAAPSSNDDADSNRDALFGGARDRVQQRNQQTMGYSGMGSPPPYEEGDGARPQEPSYEPYGDRQLTAEEEEEEDVVGTKQQIRTVKQAGVASTRNALRIAEQAAETGTNTLARIGAQGERIHNTEKNLDLTANHNLEAEDKARELQRLNRSLWALHVSNPFTSSQRADERDRRVIERHQAQRAEREATRLNDYQTTQRLHKAFQGAPSNGQQGGSDKKEARLAERAKYQFEADSEDDEMENEIENNLTALDAAAGRLNHIARATATELEAQNKDLERINVKGSKVDDEIALNRARLDRFH